MTEPVFEKVTAFVMVQPPFKATLYAALAVFSVVAVKAPVNAMVLLPDAVSVTVAALTVLPKVVPPD